MRIVKIERPILNKEMQLQKRNLYNKTKYLLAPLALAGSMFVSQEAKAQGDYCEQKKPNIETVDKKSSKNLGGEIALGLLAVTGLAIYLNNKVKNKENNVHKKKESMFVYRKRLNNSTPVSYLNENYEMNQVSIKDLTALKEYKPNAYKAMGTSIINSGGHAVERIAMVFRESPDEVLRAVSTVTGNKADSQKAYEKLKLAIDEINKNGKIYEVNPKEFLKGIVINNTENNNGENVYISGAYQQLGKLILNSGGIAVEQLAMAFKDAPDDILREISEVPGNKGASNMAYVKLKETMALVTGKMFAMSFGSQSIYEKLDAAKLGRILKEYYNTKGISLESVFNTNNYHMERIILEADDKKLAILADIFEDIPADKLEENLCRVDDDAGFSAYKKLSEQICKKIGFNPAEVSLEENYRDFY